MEPDIITSTLTKGGQKDERQKERFEKDAVSLVLKIEEGDWESRK